MRTLKSSRLQNIIVENNSALSTTTKNKVNKNKNKNLRPLVFSNYLIYDSIENVFARKSKKKEKYLFFMVLNY